MEVVGGVASLITLAQIATELAISFGRLARRLRSAEAEMEDFRRETEIFGESLSQLDTVLKGSSNRQLMSSLKMALRRSDLMRLSQTLLGDLTKVKREIKFINRKSRTHDAWYHPWRYITKRRVRWLLQQSHIQLLYKQLQSIKLSILVSLQTLTVAALEALSTDAQVTHRAEAEIEILRNQLKLNYKEIQRLNKTILELEYRDSTTRNPASTSENENGPNEALLEFAAPYLPSLKSSIRSSHAVRERPTNGSVTSREIGALPVRPQNPTHPHRFDHLQELGQRPEATHNDRYVKHIDSGSGIEPPEDIEIIPGSPTLFGAPDYTGGRRSSAPYGPLRLSRQPPGAIPVPPFSPRGSTAETASVPPSDDQDQRGYAPSE